MQVTVTARGRLAPGPAGGTRTVTLADGACADDLLAACGVDPRSCVVVVNGAAAGRSAPLRDGDRVQLYPAQAGG